MDAIVLAGGAGSRLGGPDKPDRIVGSASMLQRVVDAVRGAHTVAVIGPPRAGDAGLDGVVWGLETAPGGGPVLAIEAGLALTSEGTVLVLAADLPFIAEAVTPLVGALEAADAECAVLVDPGGRRNPLATAWRRDALRRALDAVGELDGARAFALLDHVRVVEVADAGGWAEDCDTPEDLARARERADQPFGPIDNVDTIDTESNRSTR